jgi:hypothetical protein
MERSHRIFVVNAPFWFSMPWKGISPLLHPNTQKKVSILGVGSFEGLYGDDSPLKRADLPPCYGGTRLLFPQPPSPSSAAAAAGGAAAGRSKEERPEEDARVEALAHSVEEEVITS